MPTPSNSQRGAMFGLDARLAMLIFGIMAMVAGYVSFGRIGTAKQAALVRDLESLSHALEEYQTDMGTFYLFTLDKPINDDSSLEDIEALWNKSKVKQGFQNRWHGPYVMRESRVSRTYGNYSIFYAQGDRKNYCTTDSDCYIWLSLSKVPETVWDSANTYYDGKEPRGSEVSSGRLQADNTTDPRTLILRTISRPQ